MQGPSTTQGNPFKETEPVLGVPVDQTISTPTANAQNTLPVISDGFCVPHDVVFTLQANLNPRSTEIYNVIDSAGTGQFRWESGRMAVACSNVIYHLCLSPAPGVISKQL